MLLAKRKDRLAFYLSHLISRGQEPHGVPTTDAFGIKIQFNYSLIAQTTTEIEARL